MLIYLFWQRLQLCSNANLDDARSLLGTSWIEKLSESFEFLKRQSSFCFCVSHHPDPEWCFLPSTENLFCTRTKEKVICPGFALFSLAVDENANSTWQAGKGLISRTMKSRRVRKVKHFGIYGSGWKAFSSRLPSVRHFLPSSSPQRYDCWWIKWIYASINEGSATQSRRIYVLNSLFIALWLWVVSLARLSSAAKHFVTAFG